MQIQIKVLCQYFENYSDTSKPYWKPKGGWNFCFDVDMDDWFYSQEEIKKWFTEEILVKQSNDMVRFETLEWEIFKTPEHVGKFPEERLIVKQDKK